MSALAGVLAENARLHAQIDRLTADVVALEYLTKTLRLALSDRAWIIETQDTQITAIRAVAATWAKKRDEPHRPMPWRSVYAKFVDNINDALGQL